MAVDTWDNWSKEDAVINLCAAVRLLVDLLEEESPLDPDTLQETLLCAEKTLRVVSEIYPEIADRIRANS
jgi:hypothetical protein